MNPAAKICDVLFCLVWLSRLQHRPITEMLWVRVPVRAHTWVTGSIPDPGRFDASSGVFHPRFGCELEATD